MPDAPYDVLAQLDLEVGRLAAIRNTEPGSLANGTWHLRTADDEHLILRRYRGWPASVTCGPISDWSPAAMEKAKATIAEHNVLQLPQGVVHGDFAEWNVHFNVPALT